MKKISILILAFILTSCDPAHTIEFINKSQSDTQLMLKIDTTQINYDFNDPEKRVGDSFVYNIKQNDTLELFFGIGTWSDSEIRKQAKSIKRIEIENEDFKTIYKSKEKIIRLLKDNRKNKIGWKTKIIIKID